jgi:mono/diheme cytochrome c family protein
LRTARKKSVLAREAGDKGLGRAIMKRAALIVGFILFGTLALNYSSSVHAAAAAPASLPSAVIGDPVNGLKVFTDQKCAVCHNASGKLAPDITAVGAKRDAAWLAKFLVSPTPDPKAPYKIHMQPTKAKGADLDDLVAYLMTLKGKK